MDLDKKELKEILEERKEMLEKIKAGLINKSSSQELLLSNLKKTKELELKYFERYQKVDDNILAYKVLDVILFIIVAGISANVLISVNRLFAILMFSTYLVVRNKIKKYVELISNKQSEELESDINQIQKVYTEIEKVIRMILNNKINFVDNNFEIMIDLDETSGKEDNNSLNRKLNLKSKK